MIINRKLQLRLLNRNIRYSYIDGAAFSFMLGATTPYLGLYILRFNGPDALVSLISSVQPTVLAVFSLLAASFANSFQRKKPLLMLPSLIVRLFVLIMAVIPLLPVKWQAWAFFILWGLMYIPWTFCTLSWAPLMSNLIPDEQRGRFFGTRNALTGITTLIGTLLTGIILANFPYKQAFIGIFISAYFLTMVSLYFLNKHIEPVIPEPGESKTAVRTNLVPLFNPDLRTNLMTFKDPKYGQIFTLSCMVIFIFHIGYSMAIPLFTLRQVNQLFFDNGRIGMIATVSGITALIGSYVSGSVSDRWGYRYVLLFSTLISALSPLIWAFTSNIALLMVAAMIWGFAGNAYLICFLYMVLAVSPYKDRSRFVAMNTVIGNLAGGLGPVLGLFLIKVLSLNIRSALIVASLIMLAGSILAYLITRRNTF